MSYPVITNASQSNWRTAFRVIMHTGGLARKTLALIEEAL